MICRTGKMCIRDRNVGFQATDMKLIMAVLFLVILIVNRDRKRKVKGHA